MENTNPNPYPEKFDINLIKNPFQCRKCKQLPLMAYTFQFPGEIKCKCLCGNEWITSVYNLVGYTHLENVLQISFKNENKNFTENNQYYEELTKRFGEISNEIVTEWTKILEENPKLLIEKFKINFNLRCKKHQVVSNQYFCKTCMMPLCERCRRLHLEHEIEEPSLNDNERITQLLIKSIEPFKKSIEQPMKCYADLKEQVEGYIKKLKISKVTKGDGERNTDITKLDETKLNLYNKGINQLISNQLIFLLAQINIAVLKLSLPNPNFVVLHNVANTTEFSFSQFKTINPMENSKEIIKTSEQLLSFFSSNYLVGNYDDSKTIISKKKRINDLPFNIKSIKSTESFTFSEQQDNHKVNYVLALHDGKIAVCSSDSAIKIFNAQNQVELTLQGHKGGVNWLISPTQGELFSCSDDGTLIKWKIEKGSFMRLFSSQPSYKCEYVFEGHTKKVIKLDVLKGDNKNGTHIISASKDGTIKKWNLSKLKAPPENILERQSLISFIQIDPKLIITTSDDGIVNFWDLEKGDKVRFKKNDKHIIKNIHCFSTGSLAEFGKSFILVGEQKYVVVINFKTYEVYEKIENPNLSNISCFLRLNPASCIVSGFDKFWMLQFEELIFEIKEIVKSENGGSLFTSIASLGGNSLVSTSLDNKIIKWNYE